jgi:hypothetical protein
MIRIADKQDSRMCVVKKGADGNDVHFNIRYSSNFSGIPVLQQHCQQQQLGSIKSIGASVTKVKIEPVFRIRTCFISDPDPAPFHENNFTTFLKPNVQ